MSLEAYTNLRRFGAGEPITTSEAASRLRVSLSSASRLLASLAQRGLARRLRPGLWVIGDEVPDRFAIVPTLTAPAPAYVSFASALNYHGLIDQLPRQISVASTGRPRTIKAAGSEYVVHRIPPELFSGWTEEKGAPVARPEKALFDLAYIAAARGLDAYVPELELPSGFEPGLYIRWLERIPSARLRTMTRRQLDRLMARAVR